MNHNDPKSPWHFDPTPQPQSPFKDAWDPTDNIPTGATPLTISTTLQQTPAHVVGYGNDLADFFSVNLVAGSAYDFSAIKTGGASSLSIEIRDSTGALVGTVVSGTSNAAIVSFDPAVSLGNGTYFVVVRSPAGVAYQLDYQQHPPFSPSNTPTLTPSKTTTAVLSDTATMTPPSPSASPSPSVVVTLSPSSTATPTLTSTDLPTASPSQTLTLTATLTQSPTQTISDTPSLTSTQTSTLSATETLTGTPSSTLTSSPTPTSSPSFTVSPSQTLSATPSTTISKTITPTLTISPTVTITPQDSFTSTASITRTDTASLTTTLSRTATPTLTNTPQGSPTFTSTVTSTLTGTPSRTATSTLTNTPQGSPTFTSTVTSTPSRTSTSTLTNTPQGSPTFTPTVTSTPSRTATSTLTTTPQGSPTFTSTVTSTPSKTATSTLTNTPQGSATFTSTLTSAPTSTPSRTATPTLTNTPQNSPSFTSTLTGTLTSTPSRTATSTPTNTPQNSPTFTPMLTVTPTGTPSRTATLTGTPAQSLTYTPSSSRTGSPTLTLSPSATRTLSSTPSSTSTPSNTPVSTPTQSVTPSASRTSSPTSSATASPTATFSRTVTWTNTASPSMTLTPVNGVLVGCGSGFNIDGQLNEAAWTSGSWLNMSNVTAGSLGLSAAGKYQVYWDASNLYVGVQITKSPTTLFAGTPGTLWSSDSIELYFDMAHNKGTTYDSNDFHYTFGWNVATPDVSAGTSLVGVSFGSVATATGWTGEIRIPWSSLGVTAAQGAVYGFDAAVNVASAAATRQCQLTWHSTTATNYLDTSQFGDMTLGTACPYMSPTRTPTLPPATSTPTVTFTPACGAAPAVGANTPFITYEAEAGALGGGASVVALTAPPSTELSSPQLEASGHAYVQLTGQGQSVQWTNNSCFSITAVNIRASIPDSAGGGGINSTLDLYVNGVFRQAIALSSTQTWVYESTSNYNGMNQSPSSGSPHVFWDEARAFITGPAVAPGSTIMLKVGAANTAPFYWIDCIDVEAPSPALTQPANTLSIDSYGAQANNIGFDNASAINNALSAGQSQGKPVWIPVGTYYSSGGVLNATDVLVEGAGPWYSSVVDTSTSWSNGFFFLAHGASFQNLCIDATQPNAFPGLFAILAYGSSNNPGWTLNNVWARHTMLTWGTGVGVLVENCRVNNSFGDGININNTNGTACGNVTVTNNFARGNGDDGITLNSSNASAPLMTNCSYTHNTSVASWWADNMGIYGGSGVTVEYNLLQDSVKLNGLLVGIFGNGGPGGVMTQALVMNNTLVRCGSFGYGNKNPGIAIGGAQGGSPPSACANIVVSGNTISNAMFDGIDFFNGVSQTAQYNTISSPGLNGIGEGNSGSTNTIINNTVTGLNAGQFAFVNNDGSNVLVQGTPAASYSASNSVLTEACVEGGQDVGSISNGSYTAYNGINMAGLTSFNARVASASAGGSIQIRLDSPTGTVIGSCRVPVTGGWQTWTTQSCAITATSGTHTIYLVDTGGAGNLFNIEWFSFP